MIITRYAWSSALLVVALGLSGCERQESGNGSQPAAKAPSVLLITLDTTRADHLGCYGYKEAETPALDALAASGVLFEQAFVQVPLTLPSHASLLSGTYPISNGIRVNAGGVLGQDLPTLAEEFKKRGYRTGAFIAAWVLDSSFGLARGFDHYDDQIGGGRDSSKDVRERRADDVCNRALAWLDEQPDRAFFAWVHFFDPHYPYDPPQGYRERFADPYDGEIAFMDTQVRRLVDWLDAKQLRERTLIVVVGDHGEAFGEHDEPQHGLFIYDTTLHVPMFFSFPSRIPVGQRIAAGARLIDVMPTVLELLGWALPAELEGESLAGACRTGEAFFLPAYGETQYPRIRFGWAPLRCLITEQWKYIEAPIPELYDRAADPEELYNVIGQQPEVARELRAELAEVVFEMTPRKAGAVDLSAEAVANLESLGYVGSVTAAEEDDPDVPRRDPKEMIHVYSAYRQVKHLTLQRKYAEAVALLEPLVQQSPESDELRGVLGDAYLQLGRYSDAQREFEASLRTASRSASWWCGLGDALRGQGRTAEAVECYQKAVEVSPTCGQAYNRLGLVYIQQRDFQRAYENCRRYVKLNPRSANALTNLANLLPALGRTEEAVDLLEQALQYDPKYAAAQRAYWVALRNVGRRREAVSALRRALEVLPNDRKLRYELGWLLASAREAELRDGAEAVRLAKLCCEVDPNDPRNLDLLAAAYAETGNFAQAVETARQALRLANRAGEPQVRQHIAARLRLYESGRAYRQ
ncbi:MAG: sulfatase-like hydrolase/transferase [Phycisphaerae bacterium]|nr:sulfatase-like hydrolase/transferase [Phycisphaerae bacterium]